MVTVPTYQPTVFFHPRCNFRQWVEDDLQIYNNSGASKCSEEPHEVTDGLGGYGKPNRSSAHFLSWKLTSPEFQPYI